MSTQPESAESLAPEPATPTDIKIGYALTVTFRSNVPQGPLRSDHDTARTAIEQARPLFEQVGDVRGQASCIKGIGDVALQRSDYEAARVAFEQARSLHEQVGNVLGQATCKCGMGDIALARSDHATARTAFEQALALFGQIPEPYSVGQTYRRLARLSTAIERAEHIEAARTAWRRIGREDLVIELEHEFRL